MKNLKNNICRIKGMLSVIVNYFLQILSKCKFNKIKCSDCRNLRYSYKKYHKKLNHTPLNQKQVLNLVIYRVKLYLQYQ